MSAIRAADPPRPDSSSFDFAALRVALGAYAHRFDVEHVAECGSTNAVLLERAGKGAASGSVLVADLQTAGRGRRGRRWVSAARSSLTFSLLWRLPAGTSPAGLSLVTGLAVVEALADLGVRELALKWPNDIWLARRKLGGILIEVAPASRELRLVIGIGLNLREDPAVSGQVDQAHATLEAAQPGPATLAREVVLGAILARLGPHLERFADASFEPFRAAWDRHNALRGERVCVSAAESEECGLCGDVGPRGELTLLQADGSQRLIVAGEVSLRAQPTESTCSS